MKIDISSLKKQDVIILDNDLYRILDISHTHTWRWSATYTLRIKNIRTWNVKDVTFKSWTSLEIAEVNTKLATYLYNHENNYIFMENDTAEMYEVNESLIEDIIPFLKENLQIYLVIYEWKIVSIILPPVIEYKIIDTVPWVKWDRATAWKKWAKLETWLEVQVPLHKNIWDTVMYNINTNEAY